MKREAREFHVVVREENDGTYWAEVKELPGCLASGHDLDELKEAVLEAIRLYLGDEQLEEGSMRVDAMTVLVAAAR